MTSSKTALLAAAALLVTAPIALAQSTQSNSPPATQTAPNNGPQSTSQNTMPNGHDAAQPNAMGTTARSGTQASPATASSAPAPNGPITLSTADKRYLSRDARGEAYEAEISRLAEQKATSQDIKQYASMVVQDHEQTMQELQQFAQQSGVTLPASPTKSDKAKIDRLQQLNGSAFDRQYVQEIKRANQQDLSQEESEQRSTKSQAMKQLLSQFQQVDQKHVQDAQNLPVTGNKKS